MARRIYQRLSLLFCMGALCGSLCAQTGKTITIRMLNGKTGKFLAASGFLVRIDHQEAVHADWVVQNEDGTAKLTLPEGASLLSIHATYDDSMQTFVNCDSASGKASPVDHWYAISEILTSGLVVPDGCVKAESAAKFKLVAKPGEFVLLVRRMSTREQWRE